MPQEQHTPSVVLENDPKLMEPPRPWKVILLNDDYTPMDFVVQVLLRFFALNEENAVRVMLKVHHEGRAVAGIYPKDIAATKIAQVTAHARQQQYPLACVMEEDR
ncbi:MAG: ATP-dependent Clp protease adapter ClpS [Zoogloeaceae bacterium]|jgi:ATP-dependent Clp protease adaptor protein ClpS|nr:ATP-dependent Clp protease adapter ClpS [Zoogloeaceae bacterium]